MYVIASISYGTCSKLTTGAPYPFGSLPRKCQAWFRVSCFDIYRSLSSIVRTFYIENAAEIFPAHYTWKVAEKGLKMVFVMNKLAMINYSCVISLGK